jgi:hypothetical protein
MVSKRNGPARRPRRVTGPHPRLPRARREPAAGRSRAPHRAPAPVRVRRGTTSPRRRQQRPRPGSRPTVRRAGCRRFPLHQRRGPARTLRCPPDPGANREPRAVPPRPPGPRDRGLPPAPPLRSRASPGPPRGPLLAPSARRPRAVRGPPGPGQPPPGPRDRAAPVRRVRAGSRARVPGPGRATTRSAPPLPAWVRRRRPGPSLRCPASSPVPGSRAAVRAVLAGPAVPGRAAAGLPVRAGPVRPTCHAQAGSPVRVLAVPGRAR